MFHTYPLNIVSAASWVVNVWDGFISFDDEVAFIWPYVVVFFYVNSWGT